MGICLTEANGFLGKFYGEGAIFLEGNFLRGHLSGGQLPGGKYSGGNRPRGKYPGAISHKLFYQNHSLALRTVEIYFAI